MRAGSGGAFSFDHDRLLSYSPRMNDGDGRVALEVAEIEGKDLVDLMNVHRSNDSSIVDLNSGNPVLKHKLSPSHKDLRRLRKETQECLKAIQVSSSLLRSKAQAICFDQPRRDVPEFDEVLWKADELLTLTVERLHGPARGYPQSRVKGLNGANQDIRIDCNHRYRFSRRIAPSPIPGGT
jgi:hypothetical protein